MRSGSPLLTSLLNLLDLYFFLAYILAWSGPTHEGFIHYDEDDDEDDDDDHENHDNQHSSQHGRPWRTRPYCIGACHIHRVVLMLSAIKKAIVTQILCNIEEEQGAGQL